MGSKIYFTLLFIYDLFINKILQKDLLQGIVSLTKERSFHLFSPLYMTKIKVGENVFTQQGVSEINFIDSSFFILITTTI